MSEFPTAVTQSYDDRRKLMVIPAETVMAMVFAAIAAARGKGDYLISKVPGVDLPHDAVVLGLRYHLEKKEYAVEVWSSHFPLVSDYFRKVVKDQSELYFDSKLTSGVSVSLDKRPRPSDQQIPWADDAEKRLAENARKAGLELGMKIAGDIMSITKGIIADKYHHYLNLRRDEAGLAPVQPNRQVDVEGRLTVAVSPDVPWDSIQVGHHRQDAAKLATPIQVVDKGWDGVMNYPAAIQPLPRFVVYGAGKVSSKMVRQVPEIMSYEQFLQACQKEFVFVMQYHPETPVGNPLRVGTMDTVEDVAKAAGIDLDSLQPVNQESKTDIIPVPNPRKRPTEHDVATAVREGYCPNCGLGFPLTALSAVGLDCMVCKFRYAGPTAPHANVGRE